MAPAVLIVRVPSFYDERYFLYFRFASSRSCYAGTAIEEKGRMNFREQLVVPLKRLLQRPPSVQTRSSASLLDPASRASDERCSPIMAPLPSERA